LITLVLQGLASVELALPKTIGISGIKQIDTNVDRSINRADRLLFLDGALLTTDSPTTHGDRAHFITGFSKNSVFHVSSVYINFYKQSC
jgi:hypothetical protein